MNDIDTFLNLYGLPAIFIILLIKSIGVPIPIPADVIMLAVAARVTEGKLSLGLAFVALMVAIVVGDFVQFILVRGPARGFLYRYGRYIGLTGPRLDAATSIVRQRGPVGLGVLILTPGVRAASVAACGLAGVSLAVFLPALLLGEGVFLALHFFLGSLLAPLLAAATQLLSQPILLIGIVALLLIGLGVWFIIRRRQRPGLGRRQLAAEAFEAWNEATCPVCLTLGAAKRLHPAENLLSHTHAEVQ